MLKITDNKSNSQEIFQGTQPADKLKYTNSKFLWFTDNGIIDWTRLKLELQVMKTTTLQHEFPVFHSEEKTTNQLLKLLFFL